ncbi:hypothetical protein N2152v2_007341 [Parachlorella kessleri]
MGVVGKFKKLFKGKDEVPQPRLPDNRKQKKNGVVMARLPTRYFTGSNKMISATETYGLVKLTVLEAELASVKKGREYFAVISVGTQTLSTTRKEPRRGSSSSTLGPQQEGASSRSMASTSDGAVTVKPSEASSSTAVEAEPSKPSSAGIAEPSKPSAASIAEPSKPSAASIAELSKPTASGGSTLGPGALVWNESSDFVVQREAATMAQLSLYQQGRLDGALKNYLVGWCTVDLASYFVPGEMDDCSVVEGWFDLVDPSDSGLVKGRIRLSGEACSLGDLERQLWRRLLPIADWNGDGTLSLEEFTVLMHAFGCELDAEEIGKLFQEADVDHSGTVCGDELAECLAMHHRTGEFYKLMKRCPVDGAELTPGDDYSNLIYIWLAMNSINEGSQMLKGGFSTEAQASRAWMLRMSEWVTQPLAGTPSALFRGNQYKAGGLRTGASAAHILVYNRVAKRVEEEKIDPVLVLAMRNMYQSQMGRLMFRSGVYNKLKGLSESKGRYMDSPESVKEIEPFLANFRGQIDLEDMAQPLSSYKNFNEFFYRKLKPSARPIAAPDDARVLASAADCRLMVFNKLEEATRCWVKGKQFSLAGLLADTEPGFPATQPFMGGTMAIFRLAPQDYHRFHCPVDGTITSITDVPGQLYTVNPIAVNSRFANVFTENKRSILMLESPAFGRVAYIAVGATMVGSIVWTAVVGHAVRKGEELGYFAFGGSTIVTLFEPGKVCWDEDLVQNSLKSLETKVRMGEQLGVLLGSELETTAAEKEAQAADAKAQTQGVVPLDERPDMALMATGASEES